MVAIDPAHVVGAGGALGAILRYAVGEWIDAESFPVETVTVNIVGSFVLAVLTFATAGEDLLLFLGTGACGSFTTFSSFSFETVRLWETDTRWLAVLNAVGTLVGAGLAIGIAWGLVQYAG